MLALDGIRALAFFAVFLAHVNVPHVPGGGLGVAVFFTLSGFLITGLLLDELGDTDQVRLGRFYLRRAIRLSPAMIAVVLFSVACATFAFADSPDLQQKTLAGAPAVVLYVGNWVRAIADEGGVLGLLAHTWSLSIEEQFYLVWPVLLIGAYRWRGLRGVLTLALAGSVASLVARVMLWGGPETMARIYNGTDTNADQLLIGCALAALVRIHRGRTAAVCRYAFVPSVVVLLVLVFAQVPEGLLHTVGYSILAMASAGFIGHAALSRGRAAAILGCQPLVYLGRISYGLYLWHFPFSIILNERLPNTLVRVAVVFLCTLVTAAASFHLLEQPLLRWRNRAEVLRSERESALD